jgi:hypothetical protein
MSSSSVAAGAITGRNRLSSDVTANARQLAWVVIASRELMASV